MISGVLYSPSVISFETLDNAQNWLLSLLLENGQVVDPRGQKTLEISPIVFSLSNPLYRCTFNPKRRWSLPLALGEYCWHVSSSNDLDFIRYYASQWNEFSDDGLTIGGSCYGHRIFSTSGNESQWKKVIDLLKKDPQTRRAVLTFFESPSKLDLIQSKDIPCTCTLQFILRSGCLNAIVHMRSNDVMWGLPYDVFLFTMLQELMARTLGVGVGKYIHFSGSIHIYEKHINQAKMMLETGSFPIYKMSKMESHENMLDFLEEEKKIRTGDESQLNNIKHHGEYWDQIVSVLVWYRLHKNNKKMARDYLESCLNILPYKLLIDNFYRYPKQDLNC